MTGLKAATNYYCYYYHYHLNIIIKGRPQLPTSVQIITDGRGASTAVIVAVSGACPEWFTVLSINLVGFNTALPKNTKRGEKLLFFLRNSSLSLSPSLPLSLSLSLPVCVGFHRIGLVCADTSDSDIY